MKNGVIVARFQTPVMTGQIKRMIDEIKGRHESLIFCLVESPLPGSKNNPLGVNARTNLVAQHWSDASVVSIKDHPLKQEWSKTFDELLNQQKVNSDNTVLYITPELKSKYDGAFTHIEHIEEPEVEKLADKPESEDFRLGQVYSFQRAYAKVFPTVDIALFRLQRSEILLGKKTIDKGWRLIGGFVDPADASLEAAALRELEEEAGSMTVGNLKYEKSFRIDDWRYRYEQDKIISSLFSVDHFDGSPQGSDDLAEVRWFELSKVREMINGAETVSEHEPLLLYLLEKYLRYD